MADISINKFTSVVKLQGNSASVPSLPPSLEDTPPAVNPPGTGVNPSVSTFLQLTDTPALYTGQGAKAVSVKSDETGLEFIDFPTVTGGDEPAVKTTASADQTLPSGVLTILDYDDTLTNNATLIYSVGTDGRITVSDNGVFDITAGVVIEADALTALESAFLGIFRNGNLVAISSINTTIAAGSSSGLSCSTQIALLSGDIIDCRALVTSVGGVAPGLARRLGTLLGANATQVNSLAIVKCISNGQSFLQLSDTPASYTGQAGLFPRVNSGETGLEFASAITGTLTSGRIPFATGASTLSDDSGLTWDNVNKRLGINNALPSESLSIGGDIILTGSTIRSIRVDDGRILTYDFSNKRAVFGGIDVGILETELRTAGVNRFYINNIGKIGVNTRSPFSNGTSYGEISLNGSSGGILTFLDNEVRQGWIGSVENEIRITSSISGGYITFRSDTGTVGTERMRITNTGLVGIATTTPTNTLDVNGTARIRTINNLGTSATEVLVPSATGVVSKRTLSEFKSDLDVPANYRENNTVLFDKDYIIGINSTARSGNILFNFTGAELGATSVMRHADASAFTFPTEAVLMFASADISTTADNYFLFVLVDKTSSAEIVHVFHAMEGGVA